MYVCMSACMYVCMCVCMYVCIYIYVCVCVYVYVCSRRSLVTNAFSVGVVRFCERSYLREAVCVCVCVSSSMCE